MTAAPPYGSPDLNGIALYQLARTGYALKWTMPNFVRNGWAVVDIVLEFNPPGHPVGAIRRELTIARQVSASTGMTVDYPEDGVVS
jgi:hypothetical protein